MQNNPKQEPETVRSFIKWGVIIFSTLFMLIAFIFFLSSCTYSINLVHTQGTSTDAIDDTDTSTPDISPTITGLPAVL